MQCIVNCFSFSLNPLPKEELKAYKSLEFHNQFASGWIKEVKLKLFLNYLFKLPWLLDGSVRNIFPSSFDCSILIRCIAFIASDKIPERNGSNQLLWAMTILFTSVSPIYLADEFHFLFLLFLHLRPTHAEWCNLVCVCGVFVND